MARTKAAVKRDRAARIARNLQHADALYNSFVANVGSDTFFLRVEGARFRDRLPRAGESLLAPPKDLMVVVQIKRTAPGVHRETNGIEPLVWVFPWTTDDLRAYEGLLSSTTVQQLRPLCVTHLTDVSAVLHLIYSSAKRQVGKYYQPTREFTYGSFLRDVRPGSSSVAHDE